MTGPSGCVVSRFAYRPPTNGKQNRVGDKVFAVTSFRLAKKFRRVFGIAALCGAGQSKRPYYRTLYSSLRNQSIARVFSLAQAGFGEDSLPHTARRAADSHSLLAARAHKNFEALKQWLSCFRKPES